MEEKSAGPVKLRGHHLVCLQFLHGGGYSVEFARNILRLREQFESEGAAVVAGHDQVCSACPRHNGTQKCMLCPESEDHVEDLDVVAEQLLNVRPGDRVSADEMHERISRILPEWRERACSSCTWAEMCSVSINLLSRT